MPNFTTQIQGEPEPRSFRYNVAEQALYTDHSREHPLGGMAVQEEAKITAETANHDPMTLMWWQGTEQFRRAYHLCEESGISFEEALQQAGVALEDTPSQNGDAQLPDNPANNPTYERERSSDHDHRDGMPLSPPRQGYDPPPEEQEAPQVDSIAGIMISGQQILLSMAFEMLDQYVSEDDKNYGMLQLLKNKAEELDDEISV